MSGLFPPNVLSYTGLVSTPFISKAFPPTSAFFNFVPPTIWLDSAEPAPWILLAKPQEVANWMKIANGQLSLYGILVPSGTSPVTVDANNDIAFTSSDSSVSITGSASSIDFKAIYYSLSPYIVGQAGDVHAQYTSIQAAIDQAVADGASSSTPKTIYIKPGTYTGNLVGNDGITLFAFGQVNDFLASFNTVIAGSLTLASGSMIVNGISFQPASSTAAFNLAAGTLNLTFCSAALSGANCFELSTSGAKTLNLFYCLFTGSGASAYVHDDGSNSAIEIQDTGSNARFPGAVTTFQTSTSTVGWTVLDVGYRFSISASSATFNYIDALGTWFSDGTNPLLTTGASTIGSIQLNQTNFICTTNPTFAIGNSAFVVTFPYCSAAEGPATFSAPVTYSCYEYTSIAGRFPPSGLVFADARIGFTGSEHFTRQAFLNASTASITTLISIPVAAGESILLQGSITAANVAHTDMTGGTFSAMADGTTAALVGSPAVVVYATSTGTFAVSFSGGNLLVQVTAPSAAAYNWVSTFFYQKMISNA